MTPSPAGTPEHSPTTRWRAWIAILVLLIGLAWTGCLRSLELGWLDARFALRRHYLATAPVPEIVLVAADERSLQLIPEPMALWHRPLALVFERLAEIGPRAVGIDLALPERSYESLLPGGDARLAQALAQLKRATALVLAIGADGDAARAVTPHPLFLAAAGVQNNGLAHFRRDADGTVRRFSEALGIRGESLPTLSGQIARHLDLLPHEGIIDFSRGPDFDYVPLHALTDPSWNRDGELAHRLAGKIVLLGVALPFLDRHMAPVRLAGWEAGVDVPGLVLHAQALRSLLGGHLIRPAPDWVVALLGLLASTTIFLRLSVVRLTGLLGLLACLLLLASLSTMDAGWDLPLVSPLLIFAAVLLWQFRWHYQAQARARRRLLATFGGYVSPLVLEALLSEKLDPSRPLQRRMVFLFADLRDFSGLSKRLSPEQVFSMLNRYYAAITPALHAHGATIDNFRGDGLMAFFGAPQELPKPELAALNAARAALSALGGLNQKLVHEGLPQLRFGISLAAGDGVAGNIGDRRRNNYTALADAANVAAHLQSIARNFDCEILGTSDIAACDPISWKPLGNWMLKDGREVAVFGYQGPEMQNPP